MKVKVVKLQYCIKNILKLENQSATNYRGFYNFEAFWQSGKVYKDIPVEKYKRTKKTLGKKVLY